MMCRLTRLLLPLYVGGDLSGGPEKWVAGHVDRCESCVADLEKLNGARDQVKTLAKQDTPSLPLDFAAQIREQIEQDGEQVVVLPKRQRWVWAAAAMLLIAGFGWFSVFEDASEIAEDAVIEAPLAVEEPVETFSAGDLEAMMSLLNPNRELTDAELDRKYPVVESVNFPNGTQMVYHTDDPNTKVVWVVAQEGVQVQ